MHELIQKYFDGLTTVEEENLLRRMLASGEYHGEDVDEACAVMGIFAVKRKMAKEKPKRKRLAVTAVARAACLAAVIIGASLTLWHTGMNTDNIAEINGIKVTQSQALAQMQSDLSLFGETYDEVNRQLADDFASMGEVMQ